MKLPLGFLVTSFSETSKDLNPQTRLEMNTVNSNVTGPNVAALMPQLQASSDSYSRLFQTLEP